MQCDDDGLAVELEMVDVFGGEGIDGIARGGRPSAEFLQSGFNARIGKNAVGIEGIVLAIETKCDEPSAKMDEFNQASAVLFQAGHASFDGGGFVVMDVDHGEHRGLLLMDDDLDFVIAQFEFDGLFGYVGSHSGDCNSRLPASCPRRTSSAVIDSRYSHIRMWLAFVVS